MKDFITERNEVMESETIGSMAKQCSKCNSGVFSKGLCRSHWLMEYGRSLKRKALLPRNTSKIKPISDKREGRMRIYKVLADAFKEAHPNCEARLEGCEGKTTEVHHKAGRENYMLIDAREFLAVCSKCHRWITDHSKEAIEMGLCKRRNT